MQRRRTSSIDASRLERLQDHRSAAEIRASIHDRVGGERIPSQLSRATIVEAIVRLAYSRVARSTTESMNERQLRSWLADLCGVSYIPANDRGLSYRREELQQIDQTLEDGGPDR